MTGVIERMERGGRQHRRIADVMQPGRGDEVWAIVLVQRLADAPGLTADPADVLPSRAKIGQQRGGVPLGPDGQRVGFHIGTLSAGAGLRKPNQALHELRGLAVLGLLEVGVGGQGHVAVGVARPTGDVRQPTSPATSCVTI